MSGIAEIPRFCPYCKKDLDAVYSKAGACKHIWRCSKQRIPTYTYRASADDS